MDFYIKFKIRSVCIHALQHLIHSIYFQTGNIFHFPLVSHSLPSFSWFFSGLMGWNPTRNNMSALKLRIEFGRFESLLENEYLSVTLLAD